MTFFNRDKLRPYDKWSIRVYIIISLIVWLVLFFGTSKVKGQIMVQYLLATHLFLYFFNYKSLRNLKVFGIWSLIGGIHLCLYFVLIVDPHLMLTQVHAALGFRNTIILLMFFQVLRFVSLAVQDEELVCPSKGGADLLDNRGATFIDFICLIAYMAAMLILDLGYI